MFGHRYFGASYFGPAYWGPANGTVTPPTPTPEVQRQAGGGSKRRRQIVFKDGHKVEARTEAEFQHLLWEMLNEAEIKEFTPPKAPKKRKPGTAPNPYVVRKAAVNYLRAQLLEEIDALRHQAVTEQAVIALARLAIQRMLDEEEEAAVMLLLS